MQGVGRNADQVSLLLRVGLGSVWVYQGLIAKLLLPNADLVALLRAWSPAAVDPTALLRMAGGLEVLLGFLLMRGWMLRWVAAVQCTLLALFTLGLATAAPQFLTAPTGAVSKNLCLFAAGLCLWILGRRGETPIGASGEGEIIPLILRAGLGVMWLYEGVVPKFLAPSQAELDMVARTGLVSAHLSSFLALLGIAETALGLAILAGLWTRGLAVLQVACLGAFTAIIGWTSPVYLRDALGTLSKNLGLMAAALALYRTGGGVWALDAWLGSSPRWGRWRLLANLHWTRAKAMGLRQIYRMQMEAAPDPGARGLFEKLELDEANHGEDLGVLIHRHGGRALWVGPLGAAGFWIPACLTMLLGKRMWLQFDLWAETSGLRRYARCANLLAPGEGITQRALQAMQNQEAQHIHLLQDHLRAMRGMRARTKRRR
jgi:uncharacterized membrane protein YphA (DoxX/SURF4 family)